VADKSKNGCFCYYNLSRIYAIFSRLFEHVLCSSLQLLEVALVMNMPGFKRFAAIATIHVGLKFSEVYCGPESATFLGLTLCASCTITNRKKPMCAFRLIASK
jgi:hypothetical protein